MNQPPIRVFLVDDHPLIREGMIRIIESEPGMTVAGFASSGEEAIEQYRTAQPDIVLMDLRLPGKDGIATLTAIRAEFPGARAIVLSTFAGDEHVFRALQAGACSYLTKDVDADDLVNTIRLVHAGRKPLPPAMASKLAERMATPSLSAREREVLALMARGLRNKEIGGELGISEQTAQTHVRSILSKLDVNDRTEAVTLGLRRGIIDLDR